MTMEISKIEIIDAQIHEPNPTYFSDADIGKRVHLMQVEMAREALDSVGVDIALAVTSEAFYNIAHDRIPGRFPGVHTFSHTHPDLASEVKRVSSNPAVIAGRALIGDYRSGEMRPEFAQGVFDPIYATAEEVGLPIFNSTHGGCKNIAPIAERHPNLILIVDHIGVAQHPVSPPEAMSWAPFEDLIALAKYPNVYVKLCGAPLLSQETYPYLDIWPNLNRMFDAFGYERILWGSDYTRLRQANLPKGDRPRRRGVTYADSLNYLLQTTMLSFTQKKLVLGGNAKRLFSLADLSPD